MFNVVIDDVWDGRVGDYEFDNEKDAIEFARGFVASDTWVTIYKNGELYKQL